MKKYLNMAFEDELGKSFTMRVDDPVDGVDADDRQYGFSHRGGQLFYSPHGGEVGQAERDDWGSGIDY